MLSARYRSCLRARSSVPVSGTPWEPLKLVVEALSDGLRARERCTSMRQLIELGSFEVRGAVAAAVPPATLLASHARCSRAQLRVRLLTERVFASREAAGSMRLQL